MKAGVGRSRNDTVMRNYLPSFAREKSSRRRKLPSISSITCRRPGAGSKPSNRRSGSTRKTWANASFGGFHATKTDGRKADVDEERKETRLQGLKDQLARSDDPDAEELRQEVDELEQRIEELTEVKPGTEVGSRS
jgi:hypothetical protein